MLIAPPFAVFEGACPERGKGRERKTPLTATAAQKVGCPVFMRQLRNGDCRLWLQP